VLSEESWTSSSLSRFRNIVTSSSSKSDPSMGEVGEETSTLELMGMCRLVSLAAGSRTGELTGWLAASIWWPAGRRPALTGKAGPIWEVRIVEGTSAPPQQRHGWTHPCEQDCV